MKKVHPHRVLLAELSMAGVFHAGVNAGFIRLMHEVYPDAEIHFTAEKSHIAACRKRLPGASVRYRKWPVFPKATKWSLPVRDILGCMYVVWLFLCSRKTDHLFITNLLPLTHWCVWVLNGIFQRKICIALHGQLEVFLPDSPLHLTKAYFRLHGFLFRRDWRTQYVILGVPVYETVKPLFNRKMKVIIIDHPYDYGDNEAPVLPLEYPLRFGQVGVGNRGKGTENLFRLGELLQDEIEAGQVELHLVGRLDPELRVVANRWVKWSVESLSEEDFAEKINSLHYTLLLRDARSGQAVASGSFFDSVKYGKPFLSLDSAFVRHYTGRFPGGGEVFPTIEELADAIRRICRDRDNGKYQELREALCLAQRGLSMQQIAESFKIQLKR